MNPHSGNLRIGRCSSSNQVYHITTATKDREPVFNNFKNARVLINALKYIHAQGKAATLCFVVMPDHLHWLLQLGEEKALSEVIASAKRYSSRHCHSLQWQAGFHDHALRKEEDLKAVSRYIINNPIRAGLSRNIKEYPHWDAIWL